MAVIIKRVDSSARPYGRSSVFVSGTDFNVNDVLDLESSIGGSPVSVTIETAAASSCTYRLNSMNKRYPPLAAAKRLNFYAPDLQNEGIWMNPNAPEFSLSAGETAEVELPVANIEFTAVSGTITVTARS